MAKKKDDIKRTGTRTKKKAGSAAMENADAEPTIDVEGGGEDASQESDQRKRTSRSTRRILAAVVLLAVLTVVGWYTAAATISRRLINPGELRRTEDAVRRTEVLSMPPEAQRQLAVEFLGAHANVPQFLVEPVPEAASGSVISDIAVDEIVCYITKGNEVTCVVEPLCIDHGALVMIDAVQKRCVYLANTGEARESVDTQACKTLVRKFYAEAQLDGMRTELKRASWFRSTLTAGIAHIFPMDIAFMYLKQSNSNIAHFGGRIMYLQHLISFGPQLYNFRLDAVLLQLSEPVWNKSFSDSLDSWQQGALRMVAFPLPLYLDPISDNSPLEALGRRGVQVLPDGLGFPSATVCYRRAALPAFLKGRFFIPDSEVLGADGTPAVRWDGRGHQSGQGEQARVPLAALDAVAMKEEIALARSNYHVRKFEPMDAHVMRVKWSLALRRPRDHNPFELVYLARYRRRAFGFFSERRVEKLLREVAATNRLRYRKVEFGRIPSFQDQMAALQHAIVAVGLHGANLVNTAMLDSRASVVELFPFGFTHGMYREGSGSGLGYYSHEMMSGEEFRALKMFPSRRECMNRDSDCKLWYRSDRRRVHVDARDLAVIRATVLDAIGYSRDRMLESVKPPQPAFR